MNALADALKPLAASGPKLLAALSKIQEPSDRECLAEAVAAALVEQASRSGQSILMCSFFVSFFFSLRPSSRDPALASQHRGDRKLSIGAKRKGGKRSEREKEKREKR